MNRKSLFKRYLCLLLGLLIISFGVAFSIKANLGTSPVSSVPYVVSQLTPLTVGNVTILLHSLLILIQLLLLRRRFTLLHLLQLPAAIVFGYMTDFAIWATAGLNPVGYGQQLLCCAVGVVLVGLGVSLEFTANVLMLAAEGMSKTLSVVTGCKPGNAKVAVDSALVATAVVLSLVFLHRLSGVREGTVAAALLVGTLSKFFTRVLKKPADRLLGTPSSESR